MRLASQATRLAAVSPIRTFACVIGIFAAIHAASAFAQRTHLRTGEGLTTGQYLQSPNKTSYALMQVDGNLCVNRGTPAAPQGRLWCHHKVGPGGQFVTVMGADGNLCTYRGTSPTTFQHGATWCSNVVSGGGPVFLVQQDDGNLCVYKGTPTHYGAGLWCHNTNVGGAPQQQTHCTTPRCGIPDSGGAQQDGFSYDCSRLTNPTIRRQCTEHNAAIQAALAACPRRTGKGWQACIRGKLPKLANSLPWDQEAVEQCFKRNTVAASCRDAFPWWMLMASGGRGQLQTCQNAYRTSGADGCLEAKRLIELCGDWRGSVLGSSGSLYRSPYSREECLAEARKR